MKETKKSGRTELKLISINLYLESHFYENNTAIIRVNWNTFGKDGILVLNDINQAVAKLPSF